MKPESLLGIALEIIQVLDTPGGFPADARVGRFFRERRFLGSRDRKVLSEAAYSWLRHAPRARPRWTAWASERGLEDLAALAGRPGPAPHLADVLTLARDGLFPWRLPETLAAARGLRGGAPAEALREDWVAEGGWPADPLERIAAELSLPVWLAERLVRERGEGEARRLALALLRPGTPDLRVNLRRADRDAARRALEEETGRRASPTPWSPLGLRLEARTSLAGTRAFREGWVEVEDEGSQLAVLCLDARPGMRVIDACTGAGGKALALADALAGGPGGGPGIAIKACDPDPRRLAELEDRARRAGAGGSIRTHAVPAAGPPPPLEPADLVLVDAPCSGLGTLRRNPELKLRHGPAAIAAFAALQREILERYAPLVRPGGTLAYVTCSLLAEENEDVADAFGAAHPELAERGSEWAAAHLPPECIRGARVRFDPVLTGTDGFFVAMWRR